MYTCMQIINPHFKLHLSFDYDDYDYLIAGMNMLQFSSLPANLFRTVSQQNGSAT